MRPTLAPSIIQKEGTEKWLYEVLRRLSNQTASSTKELAAVSRGENPIGGGTLLDLSDYLKLSGRPNQHAIGRNIFDAKTASAGSAPTGPNIGFAFQAASSSSAPSPGAISTVNITIEENLTGITLNTTREWAFPNFNDPEGQTAGVHFFADLSDYQTMIKKTFNQCWYGIDDSPVEGGLLNLAGTKRVKLKISDSIAANRNATTHANTDTVATIQIPPMDIHLGQGINTQDKKHTFGVFKTPLSGGIHTPTPFEDSGFVHGGDSRAELYSMYGTAKGTLSAPTQGSLPQYNASLSISGDLHLFAIDGIASNLITNISPNTTGIKVGQRIRQTITNYSLADDTFIVSIDSATQVTMSQDWTGSPTVGTTFKVFGPN